MLFHIHLIRDVVVETRLCKWAQTMCLCGHSSVWFLVAWPADVTLDGWKMQWAVILSKSAALNAKPAVSTAHWWMFFFFFKCIIIGVYMCSSNKAEKVTVKKTKNVAKFKGTTAAASACAAVFMIWVFIVLLFVLLHLSMAIMGVIVVILVVNIWFKFSLFMSYINSVEQNNFSF